MVRIGMCNEFLYTGARTLILRGGRVSQYHQFPLISFMNLKRMKGQVGLGEN